MKIAVFVDGSNLYYMQKKHLSWHVDLKKLLGYLNRYGEVVDACYYTAIDTKSDTPNAFLTALPHMGFSVVSKPLKYNGSVHKGNLDVEIVVDMLTTINTYDLAVLVSGDGDFEKVLRHLKSVGKQFLVISHPSVVAKEILAVAGLRYIDIKTLEPQIQLTTLPSDIQDIADIQDMLADMAIEEEYPA